MLEKKKEGEGALAAHLLREAEAAAAEAKENLARGFKSGAAARGQYQVNNLLTSYALLAKGGARFQQEERRRRRTLSFSLLLLFPFCSNEAFQRSAIDFLALLSAGELRAERD